MAGRRNRAAELKRRARTILEAEPLVQSIDYVSIADSNSMQELDVAMADAMLSTAAWLGNVRLIDNLVLASKR